MIDQLPEAEWEEVQGVLEKHLAKHDPVLQALMNAPEDNEEETEAERAPMEEAYEALARGEAISDEELKRELGL